LSERTALLPHSRARFGFALAVAAAVAFAFSNMSASLAYHGGSNPLTVAAVRFVIPAVALFVWLRLSGISPLLPLRDGLIAVGLGGVTAIYSLAVLSAMNEIPVASAILIFYLFPLLAALVLSVCGWEKLRWWTVASILLAFFGLALALGFHEGNFRFEGVALALVGALGFAVVVAVSGRVFRFSDPRPFTFHMLASASILLSAVCVARGEFIVPQTDLGWIGFVGAAALYAFAIIAFFVAVSKIGPVPTSLLSYAEPVVTAGLGVIVLNEALTLTQIAGFGLVVVALIGATVTRASADNLPKQSVVAPSS
jgi:drug/metabolite transporter (DMT)-like permease